MGADMERSKYDFSAVTVFVAIAAISLMAGQALAQSPGHDMADGLKLNVVKIEAVSADHTENGFGFIVGERSGALYVATAYHVVAPPEGGDLAAPKVKVQFYDHQGTSVDATIIGTHDIAHDLAVLTVVPPQGFEWKKHCLGRTNEHQKLGTEVWYVGKTGNWNVPVSPGRIANEEIIDGVLNVETLSILPGSSGGPLIAPSGIVGLILRDDASNTTALSITYVKTIFKQWNHPWNVELADAATPPPVVAQVPPTAPPQTAPSSTTATADPAANQQTPRTQSRASSTAGTQLLGALVGGFMAAQTNRAPTDRCQSGYVWREARHDDHVCVAPEVRQRTADENATAASRRDPGGVYGRDTCLPGYVWRDAVQGDHVCVVPRSRDQAASDNRNASARVAH
ncbi:MAG: hypothetical protein QOF63_1621 [Thermoanaerobaculia bacterium]|nr:hypothetical protein [Thermoanaerobaculia bacterium]